jgi:hypothetical protein
MSLKGLSSGEWLATIWLRINLLLFESIFYLSLMANAIGYMANTVGH